MSNQTYGPVYLPATGTASAGNVTLIPTTTGITTTSGGYTFPQQQWAGYPGGGVTYHTHPPTLPIKLTLKELVTLMRALEGDPDLKGVLKKFEPFMGVDTD